MPEEQIIDQPIVESPQPVTEEPEQTDSSLRRYRHEREGSRPRSVDRKPYAHAEQPFEENKWQPSESEGVPRGVQKRIDKLTREKSDLERRLAEAERRNQGESQPAKPQYETIEAMTDRVLREAGERERQAVEQPQTAQPEVNPEQQQRWQQQSDRYTSEIRNLRKTRPDGEQIFKGLQLPDYIHQALVGMEGGAEAAYQLAKNKPVLDRILNLNAEALRRGDENFSAAQREFETFIGSLRSTHADAMRQQRHTANAEMLRQQMSQAVKTDPELANALKSQAPPVPRMMYPAILDTANSFDVAVYLTKHPEVQKRITGIFQMSGDAVYQATGNAAQATQAANVAVIREVHRISAALEFGTSAPAQRRVERPVSQAPTPITPVGSSMSATVYDGENDGTDVDLRRYQKYRQSTRNPRRG